jgi:hypothetical protein
MTNGEALAELLLSAKELVRSADQVLESNHWKIKFGNYEFTQAIKQTQKVITKIENEQTSS